MKRLLVFLLAALTLTACSDQLDIAEQKMQEIAGDYLVTSISDRRYIYLPEIPAAERETFQHARQAKSGSDDRWYFEYTLPVPVSGNQFTYQRLSQEIIWEPAFGQYFIGSLTDKDLAAIGYEPGDVSLEMKTGKITFWYLEQNLAVIWTRQ